MLRLSFFTKFKNLSYFESQPTILVGQDNWQVMTTRQLFSGPWNGPAVSKTLLGWTIHGNVHCDSNELHELSNVHVYNITTDVNESDDLKTINDLLKFQWNFDMCGVESKDL